MNDRTSSSLPFTGERFTPECSGEISYEHWHRYCLALPLAAGKVVLDAACGEGYGSHLLASAAAAVIGVDVSDQAVRHARERYAGSERLRFEQGSCAALPLPDQSVDLVVSFETIEHLHQQDDMLAEFRRVLRPDGVLLISSPNRPIYSDEAGYRNEFHVRELDREELRSLLSRHFPAQRWYAQRILLGSVCWSEEPAAATRPAAPAYLRLINDRPHQAGEPAPPMYYLLVAGAAGQTLPELAPVSLFTDPRQAVLEYFRDQAAKRAEAEHQIGVTYLAGEARTAAVTTERDRLAAELAAAQAELTEARAALKLAEAQLNAEVVRLQGHLADAEQTLQQNEHQARLRHEQLVNRYATMELRLNYRESWRGWLRYPLGRVRQALRNGDDQ